MHSLEEKLTQFLSIFPTYVEGVIDINDALNKLAKFIEENRDSFNLSRVVIKYSVPENVYSGKAKSGNLVILDGPQNASPHISSYDYLGCAITIYSYPITQFNAFGTKILDFFTNYLFMYYATHKSGQFVRESEFYDDITGGLNGFGVMRAINDNKIDVINYACIYINLKNFKFINRKFGIDLGNYVLRQFYLDLNEFFAPNEFLGRVNSDNFVAFLKKEKLDLFFAHLDYIQIPIGIEGYVEKYNTSYYAGVYMINQTDNVSTIIDKASTACTTCRGLKESDIFYYTDDFAERMSIEQQVLVSFEKAIEDEEFLVFYQPKVSVDKKLCGAEALVRWKKNNNYISPANFTPVLERENLITILDMYMLEHVCRDLAGILKQGLEPVRVAVNFSRTGLQDPSIYDKIITNIEKYNIDPKYIEIEITESSILEDQELLRPFIEKLNRRGIAVTVDDFGTGYSSLNFIRDYNFDSIKIDKLFVDSINTSSSKNLLFLKNILKLIKDLDMKIVAEGVENSIQFECLKNIGCDIIQGYFFDKPLPKNEFIKRLIKKEYN